MPNTLSSANQIKIVQFSADPLAKLFWLFLLIFVILFNCIFLFLSYACDRTFVNG